MVSWKLEIPDDLKSSVLEIVDWLEYKKQKGQTYKSKGLEALWRMFRAIPEAKRREAVDHSMSNNWAGLFEKKGGFNGRQGNDGSSIGKIGEGERADSKFAGIVTTVRVGGEQGRTN